MNNAKFIKANLSFILICFLVSCSSHVGLREIQTGLNALIGTSFSTNTRLKSKSWSTISETKTYLELEQAFQTGCSYAILINKDSDVIESWRFTSDQELCEQKIYVPGV